MTNENQENTRRFLSRNGEYKIRMPRRIKTYIETKAEFSLSLQTYQCLESLTNDLIDCKDKGPEFSN